MTQPGFTLTLESGCHGDRSITDTDLGPGLPSSSLDLQLSQLRELHISLTLDEGCLPWSLLSVCRELEQVFSVSFTVNRPKYCFTIFLSLINIIEAAMLLISQRLPPWNEAYLNPFFEYSMAQDPIMYAAAALPMPNETSGGWTKPWLCLLPTKMKVFKTSFGRDSKPLTASDPAAYRLMMLTLMSFSSSGRESESGPSFACVTE